MVGSSDSCSLFCSFLLLTCSRVFHSFDRTLSQSSLRHLICFRSANFPHAILPLGFINLLYSFLYLCASVCLSMGCACSHVCVCMWGPEGNLECYPQKGCPLPSKQSLSLAWNSAIMLGCLVHAPRGPSCFCFPSSGVSCATHHSQPAFYTVAGASCPGPFACKISILLTDPLRPQTLSSFLISPSIS